MYFETMNNTGNVFNSDDNHLRAKFSFIREENSVETIITDVVKGNDTAYMQVLCILSAFALHFYRYCVERHLLQSA